MYTYVLSKGTQWAGFTPQGLGTPEVALCTLERLRTSYSVCHAECFTTNLVLEGGKIPGDFLVIHPQLKAEEDAF